MRFWEAASGENRARDQRFRAIRQPLESGSGEMGLLAGEMREKAHDVIQITDGWQLRISNRVAKTPHSSRIRSSGGIATQLPETARCLQESYLEFV